MQTSMSLKYEPSSEPLHNSAKKFFFTRELYRTETRNPEYRTLNSKPQPLNAECGKQDAAVQGVLRRVDLLIGPPFGALFP